MDQLGADDAATIVRLKEVSKTSIQSRLESRLNITELWVAPRPSTNARTYTIETIARGSILLRFVAARPHKDLWPSAGAVPRGTRQRFWHITDKMQADARAVVLATLGPAEVRDIV